MNQHHQEILRAVRQEAKRNPSLSVQHSKSYTGTVHPQYPLSNPQLREIAEDWLKNHRDISYLEFSSLLNSLYQGKSSDEKTLAGMLLGYLPQLRKEIDPKHLDRWLDELTGWAEIDSLCQSNFAATDLLSDWIAWKRVIRNLAKSKNISKRRASLVLLTKPVRDSDDLRFARLALETIDKLKSEKEILITKAISWLLRDLIRNHRHLVKSYLEKNADSLPKIAARETRNKL